MRFLLIGSAGYGLMTGSIRIGFAVSGSMSRLGEIGVGIPSVCPASMLQTSNGTLLIATGLGPMYRMRRNEVNLSRAGVPSPSSPINLMSSDNYVNEVAELTDPLTGRSMKLITFDFSSYGNHYVTYTNGKGVISKQARLSYLARMSLYSNHYKNICLLYTSRCV